MDKHTTHRFHVLFPFDSVGGIRIEKCRPVYRVNESLINNVYFTFTFAKYFLNISSTNHCLYTWKAQSFLLFLKII